MLEPLDDDSSSADEEAALQEQQAFLQSKEKPSVKLVRVGERTSSEPSAPSQASQPNAPAPSRVPVLSGIKERSSSSTTALPPRGPVDRISWSLGRLPPQASPSVAVSQARPAAKSDAAALKPKKKSLFAQHFDHNNTDGSSVKDQPASQPSEPPSLRSFGVPQPGLSAAPSAFTEEEVRQGHEEIRDLLSASSIAFLQKRLLEKKRKSSEGAVEDLGSSPAGSAPTAAGPAPALARTTAPSLAGAAAVAAAAQPVKPPHLPQAEQITQAVPLHAPAKQSEAPGVQAPLSTPQPPAPPPQGKKAVSWGKGSEPTEGQQPEAAPGLGDEAVQLPFTVDPQWLHMDIVETDKLRWIGSLGPAVANTTAPVNQQVRFDFQGRIIAPGTDLPTYLGLHHHGESPEAAGYSLPELVGLARSSVPAQRAVCLQTLAAIFGKCWSGAYCIQSAGQGPTNVASTGGSPAATETSPAQPATAAKAMAETGHSKGRIENHVIDDNDTILACVLGLKGHLAMLAALNDAHTTTITHAASALCALLCFPGDEVFADTLACLPTGLSLPPLCALDESCKSAEGKVGDMMCELVAKGLIATVVSILQTPDNSPAHEDCLTLLIRIARHSCDTALAVSKEKGLMKVLSDFISKGRQVPFALTLSAAKLSRVLCLAHRSIAEQLINSSILSSLYPYLFLEDPTQAAVAVEALYAWRSCLQYGLAVQDWAHIHSFVLQQIAAWAWPASHESWKLVSACLSACSALVTIAAIPAEQSPPHSLHVADVAVLFDVVRSFLKELVSVQAADTSPEWMCVFTSAVTFLTACHTSSSRHNPAEADARATRDLDELIQPIAGLVLSITRNTLHSPSPYEPVTEGLPYRMSVHPCWLQGHSFPFSRFASAATQSALLELLAAYVQTGVASLALPVVAVAVHSLPLTPRHTCLRVLGDMCLLWQRWDVRCAVSFLTLSHLVNPDRVHTSELQQLVIFILFNIEPGYEHQAAAVCALLHDIDQSTIATLAGATPPISSASGPSPMACDISDPAASHHHHSCHTPHLHASQSSAPTAAEPGSTVDDPTPSSDAPAPAASAASDLSSAAALQQLLMEDVSELTAEHLPQSRARAHGGSALVSAMLPCYAQSGRLPLSSSAPLKPLYNAALLALQQATKALAPAPSTTLSESECIQLVDDFHYLLHDCTLLRPFLDRGVLIASVSHIFCLGYHVYKSAASTIALALQTETAHRARKTRPKLETSTVDAAVTSNRTPPGFSERGCGDIGDISSQRHFLRVYSFLLEEFRIMSFGDLNLARLVVFFCRADIASDFRHQLFDSEESLKLCRVAFSSAREAAAYLYPLEADQELLQKYLHALQSGVVSPTTPLLYILCLHHLAALLFADFHQCDPHPCLNPTDRDGPASLLALRSQLAQGCLRGLSDAAYGDLLRYHSGPGSLYDLASPPPVREARVHLLKLLTIADPQAFYARHSL